MMWEFDFLYWLQGLHNPILDKAMVFFTILGDAGAIWIVIAMIFLLNKKHRKCGIAMLIAMLAGIIIGNLALKNLVMRDRPCWIDGSVMLLIENPHDYSFPSGHTLASFSSAIVMLLHGKWRGVPALIIATIISFSRMYLFVHFPTDVIASIILGAVLAVSAYSVTKFVMREKLSTLEGTDV